MTPDTRLTAVERRAAFTLAAIIAFRMLGLFMLLPVMTTYGASLHGYTPTLAGLAVGIYGFSQACFQIPLGRLSDTWGRRRVITLGLLLFALGALVAALSDSIYGVIVGRAIQGAGAVSSAVMALAADLTDERRRSKVMAIIGMTIGAAFILAFLGGPLLASLGGLAAVFWATVGLALIGLLITHTALPTAQTAVAAGDGQARWATLWPLLRAGDLPRLAVGIFVLHFVMTAMFMVVPQKLIGFGIGRADHAHIYLPVLIAGALLMAPLLRLAEKRSWHKPILLGCVLLMAIALAMLALPSLPVLVAGLALYFLAFNWLEASLPSWLSRIVPAGHKGTAMGFYASAQFLGAFVGGAFGGIVLQHAGAGMVLALAGAAALLWCLIAIWQQPLPHWQALQLRAPEESLAELATRMQALDGVIDVILRPEQQTVELRYDARRLSERELKELTARPS
ncbi:MFS transporter [Permianibacter sp. IMCC34836]|uniref:MFS transporter n=1 Tax=Permianibacter fluminis TaxID=2738515 RepID=UPI0015554BAD|nr:MFS transporter [Permianibacter fluminis]NQD38441.1 MFS transporter [Permianibacter fluminis]